MATEQPSTTTFRWTRLISRKWEDAWLERLRQKETVVTILPSSRTARLDIYCQHRQALSLLKHFGGKIVAVKDSKWKEALRGTAKPIPIRGQFTIYGDRVSFDAHASKTTPLFFPAEMAFGSGAHASTASCLRFLCNLQTSLKPTWNMLDLGTGSGILAIVACCLGANQALGVDFDPVAIRTARSNYRRNRSAIEYSSQNTKSSFELMNLRQDFPSGQFNMICANLFIELLEELAPQIFQAIKPGGWLIFSGVLVTNKVRITATLRRNGFVNPTIKKLGKWISGIAQKPG